MPFIDFTKLPETPEGLTPVDILNSSIVQDFIKTTFDETFETRFEVEAKGLKQTNADLKREKTELKERLDAVGDVDHDEYKRLQDFKDYKIEDIESLLEFKRNNGDASKQLSVAEAEKEGIKNSYEAKLKEQAALTEQVTAALHAKELTIEVADGIRTHNVTYPTVRLIEGNEKWLAQEAQKVWKRDESGNFTPMNGDRVMTGDEGGVMDFPEWVNSLRKLPEFMSMFETPAGGGAPGGSNNGGGGATHFNPRDLTSSTDERVSAIGGMFPELPAS